MQVHLTLTGSRQLDLSWKCHTVSSTSPHIWLNQKCQLLEAALPRTWNHDGCLGNNDKLIHINLPHPADWGRKIIRLGTPLLLRASMCLIPRPWLLLLCTDIEDKRTIIIQSRRVVWDNLIQCFLFKMIAKYKGIFQRRKWKAVSTSAGAQKQNWVNCN